MNVEPARAADLAPIKELLRECGLPSQDLTPDHLEHFRILRDGDHLGGVVGLEAYGRFALLRSLAVHLHRRGQGIGSHLVEDAEGRARVHGVQAVYLLTTTAEQFFAQQGYRSIDRDAVPRAIQETTEFQSLCPASALCMVKFLTLDSSRRLIGAVDFRL